MDSGHQGDTHMPEDSLWPSEIATSQQGELCSDFSHLREPGLLLTLTQTMSLSRYSCQVSSCLQPTAYLPLKLHSAHERHTPLGSCWMPGSEQSFCLVQNVNSTDKQCYPSSANEMGAYKV